MERIYNFEIFNIGNKLNVDPKIEQLLEQLGDVPVTCADISRAKRMLGYNPSTLIEDGIKNFVKWYLIKKDLLERKEL